MVKRILLTGATGFLGKVISEELAASGYEILTLGRHSTNTFPVDVASDKINFSLPGNIDIVIHVAGKAHSVPRTKEEEQEFYQVNFEGTKNLCNALAESKIKPAGFVFISTVAVYGLDKGESIKEDAPLLGVTPYAKSKIMAEEWLKDWGKSHAVKIVILRLPLVAGPNPPGNLGAMIKGIRSGKYLSIGDAAAKKSVVWAADVANIIPVAAEKGGTYNLTDGYHPNFGELERGIAAALKVNRVKKVSYAIAKLLALGGDILGKRAPVNSDKLRKITSTLTFDDSKARKHLRWQPIPVLDKLADMI